MEITAKYNNFEKPETPQIDDTFVLNWDKKPVFEPKILQVEPLEQPVTLPNGKKGYLEPLPEGGNRITVDVGDGYQKELTYDADGNLQSGILYRYTPGQNGTYTYEPIRELTAEERQPYLKFPEGITPTEDDIVDENILPGSNQPVETRPTEVTYPDGTKGIVTYNPDGTAQSRIETDDGGYTTFSYSENGVVTQTDHYNEEGQLTFQYTHNEKGERITAQQFTYDDQGNVTPSAIHVIDPATDSKPGPYTFLPGSEAFISPIPDDEITLETDPTVTFPNGTQGIVSQRDGNTIVTVNYADQGSYNEYQYGADGKLQTVSYYSAGRLLYVDTYNEDGFLIQRKSQPYSPGGVETTESFDPAAPGNTPSPYRTLPVANTGQ